MQKDTVNSKGRKVRSAVALLVLLAMVLGFVAPLMWAIIAH